MEFQFTDNLSMRINEGFKTGNEWDDSTTTVTTSTR